MSIELARKVAHHLSTLECVRAVGLVGSASFSEGDAADYDLCAFTDLEGPVAPEARRRLWSAAGSPVDPDGLTCGGGDRFEIDGRDFSIDYWEIHKYQGEIDKVVKDHVIEATAEPWFTLKTCPESICADVARCTILWDPDDVIGRWQRSVARYPDRFRVQVAGEVLFEGRFKLRDLRRARELGDVVLFHMALSDLVFCLLRVLFALNRTWFCGAKRAMRAVSEFAIAPTDCRPRIEAMLSAALSEQSLPGLLDEAKALTRELADVALQQDEPVRKFVKACALSDWPDAEPLG